jgi:SNF family Na+-dependent transporter
VALSVGWRLRGRQATLGAGLSGPLGQLWLWLIRVIVPAAIVVILVTSMASL